MADITPLRTAAETGLSKLFEATRMKYPTGVSIAREEAFKFFEATGLPSRRVEAFRGAVATLRELDEGEVRERVEAGTVTELAGIGRSTAGVIEQAVRGELPDYLATQQEQHGGPLVEGGSADDGGGFPVVALVVGLGVVLIAPWKQRHEADDLAAAENLFRSFNDGQTRTLVDTLGDFVEGDVAADRNLTRRVTAQLDRWGIRPDDSAGAPLPLTAAGLFLRHIAELPLAPFEIAPLLVLLKHPLTATGQGDSATARRRARRSRGRPR